MISELVTLKDFAQADEIRLFEKGKFEILRLPNMVIGRATYQPGWRWSLHVGPKVGTSRCNIEHLGYVISGVGAVDFEDGSVMELRQGKVFYIPAKPHDSWVVGDEPYISLHLLGASHYAT